MHCANAFAHSEGHLFTLRGVQTLTKSSLPFSLQRVHFHLCGRMTASKGSFQTLPCLTVHIQICDPGEHSELGELRGRICRGWQPGAQSPPVPFQAQRNGPGLEGPHGLSRLPPVCTSCPARCSPAAPTWTPAGGVFGPGLAVCPRGPVPAQPSADQHQALSRSAFPTVWQCTAHHPGNHVCVGLCLQAALLPRVCWLSRQQIPRCFNTYSSILCSDIWECKSSSSVLQNCLHYLGPFIFPYTFCNPLDNLNTHSKPARIFIWIILNV